LGLSVSREARQGPPHPRRPPRRDRQKTTSDRGIVRIRFSTDAAVPEVRLSLPESSRRYPQGKGAAMTIIVFRCFVIRICGSGKLRADLRITAVSAFSPPMTTFKTRSFGPLKSLPFPIFDVLPDRIGLQNLIALD